jgi:hypothetical protein
MKSGLVCQTPLQIRMILESRMDGDPNESPNPIVVMFGANVSHENVTCVMESLCRDIRWQCL